MKTDNLTRDEAISALRNGYKVRHHLFGSDEFIYMVDGVIFDEAGYNVGTVFDEFMDIRRGGNWEGGWCIYF